MREGASFLFDSSPALLCLCSSVQFVWKTSCFSFPSVARTGCAQFLLSLQHPHAWGLGGLVTLRCDALQYT